MHSMSTDPGVQKQDHFPGQSFLAQQDCRFYREGKARRPKSSDKPDEGHNQSRSCERERIKSRRLADNAGDDPAARQAQHRTRHRTRDKQYADTAQSRAQYIPMLRT
jgi:hypothetical protein